MIGVRLAAFAVAILLAATAISGCVTTRSAVQASDIVELSLAVPAGAPVHVETFNGGIEVRAVDDAGVSATVTRTGQGKDDAAAVADRDAIEVVLEDVDGVALLRAVYTVDPESVPEGTGAAVMLLVPAATPLELSTSNGPISVEGTSGGLAVQTSNAPVELRGLAGFAAVESSNGPISLVSRAAVVVDLDTSNGGITFDGSLAPGDSSFETSNASVQLQLPADAAFEIEAVTSGSTPTTTFDLVGMVGDGIMSGTVGMADRAAAGTSIKVRTSNGPVTISSE